MLKEYLVLFLLGHVLGDFYFQTRSMAEKKEKSLKWVLIHGLVYMMAMTLVCLPVINTELAIVVVAASVFHLLVDLLKFRSLASLEKKGKRNPGIERRSFFVDQALHLFGLLLFSFMMVTRGPIETTWPILHELTHYIGLPDTFLRSVILAVLLIHKPCNIVIQKLLMPYKPDIDDAKSNNNAGRFIGTVERIIMLIFLSIGQYAAIGLVLTAKSIARYDRISKEKDFAEYYLLGTLMSTLLVLVSWMVL